MRLISRASLAGAALAVGAFGAAAGAAHGQVVWADDFSGESVGSVPTSDFAGGAAGNDYTIATANGGSYVISGLGEPAPSLNLNDPTGAATATLTVLASQWAPVNLSATNNLLVTQFDYRVDQHNTGTADASPRFVLRHLNAGGQQIVVQFARSTGVGASAHLDDGPNGGDHDLALVVGVPTFNTSLITPSDANAVGLAPGVGWAPGFDFGNYDPVTTENDTHDQFYRFVMSYDFNTGAVTGTATNLTTGESAGFGRTMTAGLAFNQPTSSFLTATTGSNDSQAFFDNIQISVVPEPATASLLALAGASTLARRRRATR